MAMSSTMVEPDVVSILPVIDAEAPARRAVAPFSGKSLRPAARRMLASGLMKRKKAMVRRISSPDSSFLPSKGVPGMGIKALMGIDSMPSSERLRAISKRSSQVSPMPMMPPEQTQRPSAWASLIVRMRSSYVWVVQISGKNRRDVSML